MISRRNSLKLYGDILLFFFGKYYGSFESDMMRWSCLEDRYPITLEYLVSIMKVLPINTGS